MASRSNRPSKALSSSVLRDHLSRLCVLSCPSCVFREGRLASTAKKTAALIGEELIAVKQKLAQGEFKPWLSENCSFSHRGAARYMNLAQTKSDMRDTFQRANSVNEMLDYKPKQEPKQQTKTATLNDLRKVEHLRALRDDPSVSLWEKEAAQRKPDSIEEEIGPIERPGCSPADVVILLTR